MQLGALSEAVGKLFSQVAKSGMGALFFWQEISQELVHNENTADYG